MSGVRFNLMNLTLEGPCIIFCNIYTFQRDTQCSSTDCFIDAQVSALHVSDRNGPSSGASFLDAVCADYGMS